MNSPRLFLLILCFVCLPMIVAEENEEGFSFFRRFKRQAKPKTHEFTFEDKVAITRQHNQFRRYPEATNMEKMFWDTDLERVAQNWADQCKWQYNADRVRQQKVYKTVGESNYLSTGPISGQTKTFLAWWFSEIVDYTFSNNSCKTGRMCGHYKQVVWHDTTAVGCGVKFCPTLKYTHSENIYVVICNYGPAGDITGKQQPYVNGSRCSSCPKPKHVCEQYLCSEPSCSGKKCKNRGKLIEDVCMCDCKGTGYTGNTCEARVQPHPGSSDCILVNLFLIWVTLTFALW